MQGISPREWEQRGDEITVDTAAMSAPDANDEFIIEVQKLHPAIL